MLLVLCVCPPPPPPYPQMGTGIMATLLDSFPYYVGGSWLSDVGWALWWLAVVQFTAFSALQLARFVFFFQDAVPLFSHPVQSLFLGESLFSI